MFKQVSVDLGQGWGKKIKWFGFALISFWIGLSAKSAHYEKIGGGGGDELFLESLTAVHDDIKNMITHLLSGIWLLGFSRP